VSVVSPASLQPRRPLYNWLPSGALAKSPSRKSAVVHSHLHDGSDRYGGSLRRRGPSMAAQSILVVVWST
jgi:hypothetical protein